MEIVIEWRNGLVEVVRTSGGETGLSADVNAQGRPGARAMAMMARVRFDIFEEEGLRIDFWWYSTVRDRATASTRMAAGDIGEGMDIPNLNLEPSRVLRLIDRDNLDDVMSIDIDGKWRIRRYDDVLVNETKLERQCLYWLGKKAADLPIIQRVNDLHDKIRHAHTDWSNEQIAESYGYPYSAWKRIAKDKVADNGNPAVDVRAIILRAREENPGTIPMTVFSSINADEDIVPWDDFIDLWEMTSAVAK